jgi:hypothetical protein
MLLEQLPVQGSVGGHLRLIRARSTFQGDGQLAVPLPLLPQVTGLGSRGIWGVSWRARASISG